MFDLDSAVASINGAVQHGGDPDPFGAQTKFDAVLNFGKIAHFRQRMNEQTVRIVIQVNGYAEFFGIHRFEWHIAPSVDLIDVQRNGTVLI